MTTTTLTKSSPIEKPRFRARFNWPLIIGSLLVALVIYLSIVGPDIAPYDPLAENVILKDSVTGEWHMPPFKAFEVTGYPLGSDEFGRDLYSRLLWAIGPTLQMVAVVATVRLVLGTLIGLAAGWLTGRAGQFLDSLISGALALPGLLVALGTIAVVGVELGLIAFVIGLSVTGWAETARIVREQTRMVKSQIYIEAANAMGASAWEIISRHILRQIQAMLLMLLAFEIGSTLMLTAGLGFLGYYIGGDVWVDVSDFVARRTSGAPELGQMLATAWVRLTDPWGLVSVGSVVFALVLGFNLIGEGLRLRLNNEVQGGILRWLGERLAGFFLLIEHYITYPIWKLMQQPVPFAVFRLALGLLIGATVMFGWDQGWFKLPEADISFMFEDNSFSQTAVPQSGVQGATPTPQTQVISVNPQGPSPTPAEGTAFELPTTPVEITDPVVAWEYRPESGFAGAPVSAGDGIIYVAEKGGKIVALQQDGTVLWETLLDPAPGAGPELSPDGTLLVPDANGGVAALDGQGTLLWHFTQPIPDLQSVSKPLVSANGDIYYSVTNKSLGYVQALSATGESLWLSEQATTTKFYTVPVASVAGDLVFLAENVFDTSNGRLLTLTSPVDFPVEPDEFIAGQNGKDYIREGNTLYEWRRNGTQIEILTPIEWQFRAENAENPAASISAPHQIQIAPDGKITLWYRYNVIWLTEIGESRGLATTTLSNNETISTVVYEGDDATFTCGITLNVSEPSAELCMGFKLGTEKPLWKINFGSSSLIGEHLIGGTRTPAGFVFASMKGVLYGVMEQSIATAWETAKNQPPPAETGSVNTGSGWMYDAPEPYLNEPILGPDGTVALLGESQTMYILSAEGTLRTTFALPAPVYWFEQDGGGAFPALPNIMEDGSVLVLSDGQVYALNPDGTLRWEFPMERPPFSSPSFDETSGRWYLLDDRGALYAFAPTDGLLWTHPLEEGLRAASPWPVFGANGEVFYTITNRSTAQIEALNLDGTLLWRTPLTTFKFYRPLQITQDRTWLILDDDLVNTATGSLLNVSDLEFDIATVALGYDGKQYLIAGSTVMQWEVVGDSIQILNQVTVSFPPNRQTGIAPELSVSTEGIYWIRLFAGFGVRMINMWVNAEGEVLGIVDINTDRERIIEMDDENGRLSVCMSNLDEDRLECRGYDGKSNNPIWQVNIEGIGVENNYFYYDGRLYVLMDEDTIQVVEMVLP